MTSLSVPRPMTPEERADFGFAHLRNTAYEAVQSLWRRRRNEGMTQQQLAEAIGKDAGWVSRNLRGPGNWTLKTVGAFVQGLRGEAEIAIYALEDPLPSRENYDAYSEYEQPLRGLQPRRSSEDDARKEDAIRSLMEGLRKPGGIESPRPPGTPPIRLMNW